MGLLSWLTTPDPNLNYSFLAGVYALLSIICGGLAAAQYVYEADQVSGWWMVFAPAVPALFLYVLPVRFSLASKQSAVAAAAGGGAAKKTN